jgi:hypothetical protein
MNGLAVQISQLSQRTTEALPDSGQFASNREIQNLVERDAICEALNWLVPLRGLAEVATITQPDPPDALVKLVDGAILHCEFAVIAHEPTIKSIKHRYKNDCKQYEFQNWTRQIFQDEIRETVFKKEDKFRKHLDSGRVAKPLILVLGSDSLMTHEGLLDGMRIQSSVFDEILVHMGYIPDPTGTRDGASEYCIVDIANR